VVDIQGVPVICLWHFMPNDMMIMNYELKNYGKKQPCVNMKEARDISIVGFCAKI
jgi:hypothetical protein